MSAFRSAVTALKGKETYVLLGATAMKVKLVQVADDLVVVELATVVGGARQLVLHIDHLVLVQA